MRVEYGNELCGAVTKEEEFPRFVVVRTVTFPSSPYFAILRGYYVNT
jgi:hypothetical protein